MKIPLRCLSGAPWNKGKLIGPRPPLRQKHVWAIRTRLQIEQQVRDLPLFNLAIDSKLKANQLVAEIHDRMPLILAPADYTTWLSDEPDPRDLMRPFPAEPMRMWPISTRVNKPENDGPSVLEPVDLMTTAA
jgi:SOS response associated peptidase (SRAP)